MLHTGRGKFLALEESYHGNSLACISVASSEDREPLPNFLRVMMLPDNLTNARHGICSNGGRPGKTIFAMISPVLIERADTYIGAEWRGSRGPWSGRKTSGPFVTISREAGSGGASLARILVRKLNAESLGPVDWRVLEGSVTTQMLRSNQLAPRLARFLPEDHVPEITASIGELVGLHPNLWELVRKTNESLCQQATEGHTILVGRGANFATAGLKNGVHVRLVAPVEHRARYVADLYSISVEEALVHNARRDAARRRYVKATFGQDVANPAAYDLVINTAQVSLTNAAALICARLAMLDR